MSAITALPGTEAAASYASSNRLDELAPGDSIRVVIGETVYTYQVTEKMLVSPEQVEVLEGNGRDRLITLITCDYSQKPYLRLIVRGELTQAALRAS
jgi:sortase A